MNNLQLGLPQAPSRRTLGFFALFSIAIGVVVSQTSTVSLLQGLALGGPVFYYAFAAALLLSLCNACTFAELSLSLPQAGSISTYAEVTVGQFPAILAVFAGYVVPAIFGFSSEMMLFDSVIGQLFPGIMPSMGWALLLLGTLVLLHLAGTDVFATVQQALTFIIIAFFLIVGLYVTVGFHPEALPPATASVGFIGAFPVAPVIVLCFWTLIGCEFVTPMVEEARRPQRDVPRAMVIGLLVISVADLIFAHGVSRVLPREQLLTAVTPHLDVVSAVFGHTGRILFALIAVTASACLANAVLAAVPRMLHGMALNGQVFPVFKGVSRRSRVPVPALLFVAACPVVGLVWSGGDPGKILPLTIAAAICWMLVYFLAHVVLLVLRRRRPDLPRPFRTPFYPLPQIAAMAGLLFVIFNSSPAPELTGPIVMYSGSVLGVFGIVAAVWVKCFMRQPLFRAAPAIACEGRASVTTT
ncbi:APC family permease [Massilia niastensis]|uniref:APC family permease n=1 Tax=Massilia niastensis TaxID=544911 RepID=UPI000373CC51|nr:APC family permease [Massilia niastensis]